jgi:hypothetical protein
MYAITLVCTLAFTHKTLHNCTHSRLQSRMLACTYGWTQLHLHARKHSRIHGLEHARLHAVTVASTQVKRKNACTHSYLIDSTFARKHGYHPESVHPPIVVRTQAYSYSCLYSHTLASTLTCTNAHRHACFHAHLLEIANTCTLTCVLAF